MDHERRDRDRRVASSGRDEAAAGAFLTARHHPDELDGAGEPAGTCSKTGRLGLSITLGFFVVATFLAPASWWL